MALKPNLSGPGKPQDVRRREARWEHSSGHRQSRRGRGRAASV